MSRIDKESGLPRLTVDTSMTTEQAEDSLLEEMLARHKARTLEVSDGSSDLPHILLNAPDSLEEIRFRIKRAGALSGSAFLRVGRRFLNETDPRLN